MAEPSDFGSDLAGVIKKQQSMENMLQLLLDSKCLFLDFRFSQVSTCDSLTAIAALLRTIVFSWLIWENSGIKFYSDFIQILFII